MAYYYEVIYWVSVESTVKLHIILSRHFSGELVQQDSTTPLNGREVLTGFGSQGRILSQAKEMEPHIPRVGQP